MSGTLTVTVRINKEYYKMFKEKNINLSEFTRRKMREYLIFIKKIDPEFEKLVNRHFEILAKGEKIDEYY